MGKFPLKSWLTGLTAALSMPQIIVNTFSQYYYNGYILPELPNWDKNVYPYATILSFSILEQFNFILLCATKPFVVIDNKVALEELTTAIAATHNRSQWRYTQAVGEYEPGMWNMSIKNVIWSNYDLVDASGTVYLAASEPVPRVKREPLWETLFEGEVVTADGDNIGASGNTGGSSPLLAVNDGIRVTINGVSTIETCVNGTSIGNKLLNYYEWAEDLPEDTGTDYYVSQHKNIVSKKYYFKIYTRKPGTYTVKIERALFAPVAYLYNGVRLPVLPEWDKTVYPYAYISSLNGQGNSYILNCCSTKLKTTKLTNTTMVSELATSELNLSPFDYISAFLQISDNSSEILVFSEPRTTNGLYSQYPIWTNHDIIDIYNNEKIILVASDPVPIYE